MHLPDDLGIELICPDCRRPLARIENSYICSDGECRRAYAIIDQIPKLLVDESEVLTPDEWQAHLTGHSPARTEG